jgi:hypothetical protein
MSYPQNEKASVKNEKIEVIDILDEKNNKEVHLAGSDSSFTSSSIEDVHGIEGYVPDLQWTKAEERKVLQIIDTRLMPFVLLMTFVLNMDRTNICKLRKYV